MNNIMKIEQDINEIIRTYALANDIEEGIRKVKDKYMFNDDGTITERERERKKGPEKP